MLGRIAASAALIALAAGCAGMESAGRNARTDPAPAGASPAVAAAPAPQAVAPTSQSGVPEPAAPPEQAATTSADEDDDSAVVVPGVRERQVQPPSGDPRSNAERMQDIRAWDQCVMRVQGAAEADPMRPQLTTPEEYCSQSLGMASRTAVPQSRLERGR